MLLNSLNFKNGPFAIVAHLTGEVNFAISVDALGINNRNRFRIHLIIRIADIVGIGRDVPRLSGSGFHFVAKSARFCSCVSDHGKLGPLRTRLFLVPTNTVIFSKVNFLVQTNLTYGINRSLAYRYLSN